MEPDTSRRDEPRNTTSTSELRGRDMLCFSHDWSGDPLSKTHLMRLLAKDNRILWVNSIGYRAPSASGRDFKRAVEKLKAAAQPVREVEKNIFVLNPLVIPAYGVPAMQKVNRQLLRFQVRRAMRRLGFQRPINWVFNPAAAVVAGALGEDVLIYYCVDEYTAFSGVAMQSLIDLERGLMKRADLVVVSADRLLQNKRHENPHTVLVRHGVNYKHFRGALDPETKIPADIAKLPRPILGYFGLMADDWFDIDLVAHVAKRMPNASIVLLGKVTSDLSRLTALPNVHLLGRKPYEDLPGYCKGFDVGILPFPISEVTLNSNPLKVREYLAAGLPVVSTAIPEVEVLRQCRIGHDADGFVREIEAALADNPGPRAERSDKMAGESWDAKLEEIRGHVASLKRH
jgi:glycosyltransferase involved in cell wall biosynthesis